MTHDDHFEDFPSDHDDHEMHDASFQEELPPTDADHSEDHAEDIHGEEWDSFDEAAPTGKGGKKKLPSDKIIIGGALAIGVIIIFLKMSGGHAPSRPATHAPRPGAAIVATARPTTPTSVPQPPTASEAATKPAFKIPPTREDMIYGAPALSVSKTTAASTAPTPTTPMQGGFLNDPDALKKVEALQAAHVEAAAPPPPAPDNAVPSLTLKEVAKSPPMPSPIAAPAPSTSTLSATPPAATTQQPLTPLPTIAAPAPVAPSLTMAPATPANNNMPVNNTNAESEQLKDITAQLAAITTQLQDLQANSVRKTELAAVQTQLAALKNQAAQQPTATDTTPAQPAISQPAPSHHHAAAAHKVMHRAKARELPVSNAANHWVLKSAQPGIAIVDSGDGQLVTVQVGDHLKELGTIKSIAQKNGQWIVTSSHGKIVQ